MPEKIPSRCPNCKESIIQLFDTERIVHKYNLKEECPDNSGRIPLGLGKGGDLPASEEMNKELNKFKEALEKLLAAQKEEAMEAAEEEECDQEYPDSEGEKSDDETDSEAEPGEHQDSDEAEEEEDQDSTGDEESEGGKRDSEMKSKQQQGKKGKPSNGQPQESDNKQNMNPPPPSPPNNEEWAIPAAKDINALWAERVRLRSYKPTDEEVAKLALEHAKGKVSYKPLAAPLAEEPKDAEIKQGDIVIPAALAKQVQDALLAVYDVQRYFYKMGGNTMTVQQKRELNRLMPGLIVCEKCGTTTPEAWCKNEAPENHRWRAKFMVKETSPDAAYRVIVRDSVNKVVRECSEFCQWCNEPVYGNGYAIKHAQNNTAHCSVGGKAVVIGGKPSEPIEKGKLYYFRPWAQPHDNQYSLVDGKCPTCREDTYTPQGSAQHFHVSSGNAICNK